jgi:uncharacterized membrane protein YhaH (DUF805 family)
MSTRKSDINFDVIKDSYIGTLKKYAVFKGRARRREFWIFFFVNLVLGLIPVINAVVSLLTCIPSMAVGVRRLHDTERSGFWVFLAIIFPFAGFIFFAVGAFAAMKSGSFSFPGTFASGISGLSLFMTIAIVIFLVSLLLVIMLIVWATQEGTRGNNKYGPDPKTQSSRSRSKNR